MTQYRHELKRLSDGWLPWRYQINTWHADRFCGWTNFETKEHLEDYVVKNGDSELWAQFNALGDE